MTDITRSNVLALVCCSMFAAVGSAAAAAADVGQDYPVKPVRMIVPLAPGGGSDIVGRIVALELTALWGQSVVVDNRPGAGSVVGTSMAVKSAADGYTLLVSSSSLAISPALYKNLDFDVQRDLAAVTLLASQPSILAVQASVPAATAKDLIALAKAQPGSLKYGSAGTGSATHLGSELLKYAGHIDLLHVPYRSAGQATSSLLAGETQILLTNMASVLPHAKSGRIRVLGISSLKRSSLAPDVPTIAESGLPGFEYMTWYGMLVPVATPKPLVSRLYTGTAKVLKTAQGRERLTAQGLEVHGSTPDEFAKYLHAEVEKWNKVIKAAGVRIE
jgi:tripartite-type tricarboxylate transporter receptor subunit TctC